MKKLFVLGSLSVVLCSRTVTAENTVATNAVVIFPQLIDALAEEARTNHSALGAAEVRADAGYAAGARAVPLRGS